LTIFSTSLSVAAFLRRAGGSMLESTGSHGRGVERRVPEKRRELIGGGTDSHANVFSSLQLDEATFSVGASDPLQDEYQ